MRKLFFSPVALLLLSVMFFFNACKKESSQVTSDLNSNNLIQTKVNSWLDSRKTATKTTQSANVELLKSNLNFSEMRIEQSEQSEKIIVIPIKEGLKTAKGIGKKEILNLVLILDKAGNIRKGNIVLFLPATGKVYDEVPENTFYKILNTADPDCNGRFRYLSVTGKRLYELEYENKKLKSFSNFKPPSSNSGFQTDTNNCVDWYWVTTYYDADGMQINQTWDYVGTTCQGEDCEDPYLAMVCPMDNNGGGSGDPEGYEYAVTKPVSWIVAQPQNNWWYVKSYETLDGQKVASEPGGGHFTSITHSSSAVFNIHMGGFAVWQQLSATPFLFSGSRADCNVTGKVTFPSEPTFPEQDINRTEVWIFQAVFP